MSSVSETERETGLILNAQQFVDRIHDLDIQMYRDVLDRLSDSVPQATGEWDRDEEGNMIMLFEKEERLEWSATSAMKKWAPPLMKHSTAIIAADTAATWDLKELRAHLKRQWKAHDGDIEPDHVKRKRDWER